MSSAGYGSGLAVSVLVSIVLYLLRITSPVESVALLLLMVGVWTVVYGLSSVSEGDRMYYVGYGAGIAVLSSFIVFPLRYVVAFVLIVVILLIVFTAVYNRNSRNAKKHAAEQSTVQERSFSFRSACLRVAGT